MNSYEKCLERVGRLKPEVKVNMTIGMSDVCVRVCADGVREKFVWDKKQKGCWHGE